MREYLKEHVDYIDKIIKEKDDKKIKDIMEDHLLKIRFFQHERLIHLLVTLFYAIVTLLFLSLMCVSLLFLPIAIILCVFLILYIYHYFYLENGVQYMYKQYDELKKIDK